MFNSRFKISISSFLIALFFFSSFGFALADAMEDRFKALQGSRVALIAEMSLADTIRQLEIRAILGMTDRQIAVIDSYANMKSRVELLLRNDPRKDGTQTLLDGAKILVNSFIVLIATDNIDEDPYRPNNTFNNYEKDAIKAMNDVNRHLISPSRPGVVPEGDLLEDFVPGVIRILFRFASLAVLVAFVVSGVFFVMASDNDERLKNAKSMLYYSLIGFAFVTLAFAIVKAITDIDFFGFI